MADFRDVAAEDAKKTKQFLKSQTQRTVDQMRMEELEQAVKDRNK